MEFTWHIRDNTSQSSSSNRQQPAPTSQDRPSDGDPPQASGSQGDRTRIPSSCIHCKQRKIRCKPQDDGQLPCQRCKKKNLECIFAPVTIPPGRKQLVHDIQQRDQVIKTLLRQFHSSEGTTHLRIASFPVLQPMSNEVKLWLERQQQSQLSNVGNSAVESYAMLTQLEVSSEEDMDGEEGSIRSVPGSSPTSESAFDALLPPEKRRKASPKLHSLPGTDAPLGLIAAMSLRTAGVAADEDDSTNHNSQSSFDIANKKFFAPGPFANLELRKIINEHEAPPDILTTGLVKPTDVEKLFKIFFEGINITLKVFDPVLHTPINVLARSPFLFTVICAVSSRFYFERPDLYQLLIHFAKASAASALIDGYKSIEMCQAYMILAMYPPRVKSFQEERGYIYLGLAVRLAVDLNLNRPSVTKKVVNDQHERELLNRTRTWLILFAMERAASVLVGRTLTLPDDPVASNCKTWWQSSRLNLSWDKHITEYAEHARICGAFHNLVYSDPKDPQMFNHHLNHHQICLEYDDRLRDFLAEARRLSAPGQDSGTVYQSALIPWTVNYTRVVILGFGLHVCLKKQRRIEAQDPLILRSMEAATVVLNTFVNKLGPSNYFCYCPNNQIIFTVYCCVYLLRFLLPQFEGLLLPEQNERILQIVQQVHDTLTSPSVAVDENHLSAMYAKFLHALMKRIRKATGGYQGTVQTDASFLGTPPFSQSDSIGRSSSQAAAPIPTADAISQTMHSLFDPSNQPQVRFEEPVSPRTVPSGHLHQQVPMQVEPTYNDAFSVSQAAGVPTDDAAYWNDLMWPGVGWPTQPQHVQKPQQATTPQHSSASTPGYAADPYQWLGLGSNPSVEGWFAQYATHPHAQQQRLATDSPPPEQFGHMQSRNPQYDYGHSTHYFTGQGSQAAPFEIYH